MGHSERLVKISTGLACEKFIACKCSDNGASTASFPELEWHEIKSYSL